PAVMHAHDVAEQLRPQIGEALLEHLVDLAEPSQVVGAALHDLDEPSVVGATAAGGGHFGAVVEAHFTGEQLRHAQPPLALLGPAAVALGRLGRVEPGDGDEGAVVGHACRTSEPAPRALSEARHPSIECRSGMRCVTYGTLDHLDEHGALLRKRHRPRTPDSSSGAAGTST